MSCNAPISGYRNHKGQICPGPSIRGKQYGDTVVSCGRCIGCRLDRSKSWAIRCVHEASQYEKNCFITLTVNPENIPKNGSLDFKKHFQPFMKRLKERYGSSKLNPIRYFHCGEYGKKFARPHYHACIFNHGFTDMYFWKFTKSGEKLYRSPELESLWINTKTKKSLGYSSIGEVNFKTAAYVARYILKKYLGDNSIEHYVTDINYSHKKVGDLEPGEIAFKDPEYTTMSRRPGIGKKWFDQFKSDLYPSDFVVMNGHKMKIPKYYDQSYEIEYPNEMKIIKEKRMEEALKREPTPQQMEVKRKINEINAKKLIRGYESS